MLISIDTDTSLLRITDNGKTVEHSLFAPEAFSILAGEWLRLGWNLQHWATFSWMGRQLLQYPDDVLRLAELIWRLRPDVIVETGVYEGGSTLLFSSLCRLTGHGRVISVERELRSEVRDAVLAASNGNVTLVEGDSGSVEIAARVLGGIASGDRVLVFLDSDHTSAHVARELRLYGPLVSAGSYLIVADSNLADLATTPNGDPHWAHDHPGAAVNDFLKEHPEFVRACPRPLFPQAFDFSRVGYFPTSWLERLTK